MRPRLPALGFLAGALALASASPAVAQEDTGDFLAVGTPAPAVELTGATRYGILQEPVRLEDFRGETVVLAFFFRARTPG